MLVLCLYDYDGRVSMYSNDMTRCRAGKVIDVPNDKELERVFYDSIREDCHRHDRLYGGAEAKNKWTQNFERPSNARLLAYLPKSGHARFGRD